MQTNPIESSHKYDTLIKVLSIAIPLLVALLFGIRQKVDLGEWTKILPHLNGLLNTLTSILLLAGFYFIKNNKVKMHRASMVSAFILGSLFLVFYVLYHFTNSSTSFGGTGILKFFYYILLITHVILAGIVVPFVLYAIYYALTNQIERHKKVVKWTFPIWLYVSVTGVIVYLMISPYYVN